MCKAVVVYISSFDQPVRDERGVSISALTIGVDDDAGYVIGSAYTRGTRLLSLLPRSSALSTWQPE